MTAGTAATRDAADGEGHRRHGHNKDERHARRGNSPSLPTVAVSRVPAAGPGRYGAITCTVSAVAATSREPSACTSSGRPPASSPPSTFISAFIT